MVISETGMLCLVVIASEIGPKETEAPRKKGICLATKPLSKSYETIA